MLGPYRVTGRIGEGGMGAVYRATDTRLGRNVAIKVLTAVTLNDQEKLQRFEQEARTTGMLNHPNLLTVYDVGNHDGTPYLVTELLEGETLRDRLTRGAITPRKTIEIASQIANGLAAEIPKKSHLWADWTVWNFRRRPVHRASAMPAEALRRTQASLAYFERLEVWHAVGMADPWLVGGVRLPSNRERFYLLYDWGTETTADREDLR